VNLGSRDCSLPVDNVMQRRFLNVKLCEKGWLKPSGAGSFDRPGPTAWQLQGECEIESFRTHRCPVRCLAPSRETKIQVHWARVRRCVRASIHGTGPSIALMSSMVDSSLTAQRMPGIAGVSRDGRRDGRPSHGPADDARLSIISPSMALFLMSSLTSNSRMEKSRYCSTQSSKDSGEGAHDATWR